MTVPARTLLILAAFLAVPAIPLTALAANPAVRPSITAITPPLAADLPLMLFRASSSSRTLAIPSSSNSSPFFVNSSCKNSVNDVPVSRTPPAPAKAPPTAPTPAPIPKVEAPAIAAPPAAPTPAPAAEAGLSIAIIDDIAVVAATVGFEAMALIKPHVPPPDSS